jgi:signal transduction histidine kinase
MILADMDDDHIDYEPMMAVHRAGKRAHEVVSRLLGMAHQKDGDALLQSLDVNETIGNTLELVSRHIQKQQVLIEVELEPDLPPVYGLVGQLEDVWMNLLLNARDAVANSQYPQIGILSRLSSNNHTVVVEVWDNGIGIPQDKQDSIFTAFFTTKPQGEGTGLGLHICRQVVEKCGGEISLKHSDENGTRFEVRLPTV